MPDGIKQHVMQTLLAFAQTFPRTTVVDPLILNSGSAKTASLLRRMKIGATLFCASRIRDCPGHHNVFTARRIMQPMVISPPLLLQELG